ncbi:MAG TPA: hypothetical protein VFC84_04345 [Desulfosporosinus sp.]|nr:hypothetical protein [Desulfosporosinus sp.]
MNDLLPEIITSGRKDKNVIISCVENEWHQIGGKMVADIFERHSFDTHHLGAKTPIDVLVRLNDYIKGVPINEAHFNLWLCHIEISNNTTGGQKL